MNRIANAVSAPCSPINMRIHNQRIEKCRQRRDIGKNRMLQALFIDLSDVFVRAYAKMATEERRLVELLQKLTRHVQNTTSNINVYSDRESLLHLRFKIRYRYRFQSTGLGRGLST